MSTVNTSAAEKCTLWEDEGRPLAEAIHNRESVLVPATLLRRYNAPTDGAQEDGSDPAGMLL